VNEPFGTSLGRFFCNNARPVDVHFPILLPRICLRNERGVVMNDIHTAHGARDSFAIQNAAFEVLNLGRA
jgi:hypothetical protein